MGFTLEAYPTLTREMGLKIGFCTDKIMFSYTDRGSVKQLKASPADTSTSQTTVYQLTDPGFLWHPDTHNLTVNYTCSINTPSHLFGQKGLAARDGGVLGVGLTWMAPDSGIRGSLEIGELNKNSPAPVTINGQLKFPAGELRGTLILRTVLYLKKRGSPVQNERLQAFHSGAVLGTLEDTKVIIDGNGSIFPVQEEYRPKEPLWRVSCDWDDPNEDQFTYDNFCLYLNTAHKDFGNLFAEKNLKNSPLLLEIACSAIQILVSKVLLEDCIVIDDLINRTNLKRGSISSVVSYFLTTYNWHYKKEDMEKLSVDIRKTMMNNL